MTDLHHAGSRRGTQLAKCGRRVPRAIRQSVRDMVLSLDPFQSNRSIARELCRYRFSCAVAASANGPLVVTSRGMSSSGTRTSPVIIPSRRMWYCGGGHHPGRCNGGHHPAQWSTPPGGHHSVQRWPLPSLLPPPNLRCETTSSLLLLYVCGVVRLSAVDSSTKMLFKFSDCFEPPYSSVARTTVLTNCICKGFLTFDYL